MKYVGLKSSGKGDSYVDDVNDDPPFDKRLKQRTRPPSNTVEKLVRICNGAM
jgi:hypothetical protein